MNKILIFHDQYDDTSTVLQVVGDSATNLLLEFGNDISNWPEDLDSYRRDHGFYVWEGEINSEDEFNGTLRELTNDEKIAFMMHKNPWEAE